MFESMSLFLNMMENVLVVGCLSVVLVDLFRLVGSSTYDTFWSNFLTRLKSSRKKYISGCLPKILETCRGF